MQPESATRTVDPAPHPLLPFLKTVLRLLSWRFVGLVLLTLVIGLVAGLAVVALVPMLQVVGLEVSGGAGERLTQLLTAAFAAVGLQPTLEAVLLLNLLMVAATAWLTRAQAIAGAALNQELVNRLRRRLYARITGAEWLYLAGERGTRFNHVLLGEVERVGGALSALVSLLVNGGRALVYSAIALALSPLTTLLTLAFGALLSVLLLRRTRLGQERGEAVSGAYERLYATTGEHLAGIRFTKSHGLEAEQSAGFARAAAGAAQAQVEVVRNHADLGFWLQSGSALALAGIVYVALAVAGLPLATVLLLLYIFSRLLPMLGAVQKNYQGLMNLLPAYSRYAAVEKESESASEPAAAGPPFPAGAAIELRDVEFGYGRQGAPTLAALNLTLPAGRTTALVGPSGAGKSTIAELVIGLISPDAGTVLIGGEELTAARRGAWRRQVGYVSQDVFLFHDTIRANLLIARPRAGDAELWHSLDSAAAADFVRALPAGLDTVVGDRGVRLSGGERQRLVLARALLRRPELLVLDEATSALDAENEERIREAIDRLAGRMTILVIAHRLASIRGAHLIHVIEEGRPIESGTWDDLWRREEGRFRQLALAQGLGSPQPPSAVLTLLPGASHSD